MKTKTKSSVKIVEYDELEKLIQILHDKSGGIGLPAVRLIDQGDSELYRETDGKNVLHPVAHIIVTALERPNTIHRFAATYLVGQNHQNVSAKKVLMSHGVIVTDGEWTEDSLKPLSMPKKIRVR